MSLTHAERLWVLEKKDKTFQFILIFFTVVLHANNKQNKFVLCFVRFSVPFVCLCVRLSDCHIFLSVTPHCASLKQATYVFLVSIWTMIENRYYLNIRSNDLVIK